MCALKNRLLALTFALTLGGALFAQTAEQLDAPEVLRIADKFRCSCGCNLTMSCKMEGDCHLCRAAKTKIVEMQAAGKSEDQIVDSFVAENGKDFLAIRPGPMGVLGPWGALALGAILVVFLIRRFMAQRPAPAAATLDSDALNRYHEQIEKDLAKLE
jgi:cytochrome c-type biogenesis protein CcmH/NrfF